MGINVDNSTKKQAEGVWTKFGGSKFKVASTTSTKFQRALNRLQAPYRKKIEKGTLDPKISKEILCQAMADALLVDWEDVEDANKQPVPFSPELAFKALMNNDDLKDFLSDFGQDLENFRAEEIVSAGNS
jgi:hypothetical protein